MAPTFRLPERSNSLLNFIRSSKTYRLNVLPVRKISARERVVLLVDSARQIVSRSNFSDKCALIYSSALAPRSINGSLWIVIASFFLNYNIAISLKQARHVNIFIKNDNNALLNRPKAAQQFTHAKSIRFTLLYPPQAALRLFGYRLRLAQSLATDCQTRIDAQIRRMGTK